MSPQFKGHDEMSLEVLKLTTILFPNSFNTYDSYGEALAKTGKKDEAIFMYKKSLALNPENDGGKKHWKNFKKRFHPVDKRHECATKDLAIWWQDVETSAMCYYQQQFQPTNIYELLFVIFIFSFFNRLQVWANSYKIPPHRQA